MNKIKLFLGVAVLFMAVAGAFATKNTKWNRQSFYYVIVGSTCTLINQTTNCSQDGEGCKDENDRQIYLQRINSSVCAKPVRLP